MARKTLLQVRRDTAANWTSANPTLSAGEPGFETDTGKVKFGDGSTAWTSLDYVASDAHLSTTDITTNNASTSKHGFLKKLDNNAAHFMDGTGNWSTPAGTGSVASDAIWDAKGDLAAGTGADTASKLTAGSNGKMLVADSSQTTGLKWASGYLGGLELVYRYTVTGSDKASIDTGADTADAGSNDWTNGDMLEVCLYWRTDEAVVISGCDLFFNNDTATNYEVQRVRASNTTVTGAVNSAHAGILFLGAGASAAASVFSSTGFTIPNFAGTVGFKACNILSGSADPTAANKTAEAYQALWKSTSAITRIKVQPDTAAKKLKIGTQLLIYKRLAS